MQAFKSPAFKTITGSFNRSIPRNFSTTPISRFAPSSLKMAVTKIETPEEYAEKVTNAPGPVVVDFFATWCGPCKAISPAIEKLSEANTAVAFYKVDVDQLAAIAADNGVSAMPTFHFRKGGEKVGEVKGANPPAINAALQKLLE
ncbi:hypothetical protein N7452_004902 [Penicillium brevicompactum]|uniref:Thioredoxin domain-containing protein n=1 Tax=Penicillium brevicompactum TaxID=5074 RepID=A0A9W9QKG8_PENBR|nr:hypothetical protein N7452_004902 [Penicillium brevicompactum]